MNVSQLSCQCVHAKAHAHNTKHNTTASLRKQPTFREAATWALAKRRLSNERRNSTLMTCTTLVLVVLLTGWKKIPLRHNQSETLPRSGLCTSSVWNFCARYSDVVLRGLKWRPRETSAVFSGYTTTHKGCLQCSLVHISYLVSWMRPRCQVFTVTVKTKESPLQATMNVHERDLPCSYCHCNSTICCSGCEHMKCNALHPALLCDTETEQQKSQKWGNSQLSYL